MLKAIFSLRTLLLGIVLVVATGTGVYSYKIGSESLKGVTQPDVNPAKKITGKEKPSDQVQEFVPVKEKEVLAKVATYIKQKDKAAQPSASPKAENQGDKNKDNPKASPEAQKNEEKAQTTIFPVKAEDQGVVFEITQGSKQGNSLLFNVNLQNNGQKPVEFLYSFLEIKDQEGNSLTGIVDGLPDELPANGENFAGTIKIPASSNLSEQKLSLNLTDYPEQKLKLSINDISVAK